MKGNGGAGRSDRGDIDERLVRRLKAIASPSRLQLLAQLKQPSTVSEIRLETAGDEGRDAKMTAQGVRHHLAKLRSAGFVESRSVDNEGQRVNEYLARTDQLYELAEAIRAMPTAPGGSIEDLGAPPTWDPPAMIPSLTVVHGEEIGRSFALAGEPSFEHRGWVIGQGPNVDVPLAWDALVDDQAGEIEREGGEFRLIDLRSASRRLSLNGEELERGASRPIADGDLVGVGRSLLCFRE
jgi:DNA-binding transcriptional ArsR family regulator